MYLWCQNGRPWGANTSISLYTCCKIRGFDVSRKGIENEMRGEKFKTSWRRRDTNVPPLQGRRNGWSPAEASGVSNSQQNLQKGSAMPRAPESRGRLIEGLRLTRRPPKYRKKHIVTEGITKGAQMNQKGAKIDSKTVQGLPLDPLRTFIPLTWYFYPSHLVLFLFPPDKLTPPIC